MVGADVTSSNRSAGVTADIDGDAGGIAVVAGDVMS